MKRLAFTALGLGLGLAACQADSGQKVELNDQRDKVGYSIGLDIGTNIRQQQVDVDAHTIARGLEDGMLGHEPMMTDEEIQQTMMAFQQEMMAQQQAAQAGGPEEMQAAAAENLEAGQAFLAEHAEQEGVTVLPSGLQYKVLEEGSGKSPSETDTVTTHYRGTLVDGTEFDSSYQRGEPAQFPVNGVIPGWTEALQLMEEGAKWQLVIPSDLAYGEQGAGGVIGPNSTLIFEIELLEVQ